MNGLVRSVLIKGVRRGAMVQPVAGLCPMARGMCFSLESRPVIPVSIPQSEDNNVEKVLSVNTANKKGELKLRISDVIKRYQAHPTDRGSTAVQIAILTEKIGNLARHFTTNKKDKHSMRGFQGLINKRRSLMKYMKRNDFDGFLSVVKSLGLEKEATQLGGRRDN